ncbi:MULTISPECIES: hypothetical protein [unclassified Nostoc]|uniref:hypothetical protein n=1 Tax=unclassified Nostoc TaxID=2593658 RepID=UPI002AD26A34|nr:hypothetical protein [Nostoc sp. DedQUE03]MDZ7976441.1 hypothetical protein [Nostoc sp. DedQUE03]MDZ8042767.1 hypothetical protein [Nostoc sp. DedQUE02]
MTTRAFRGITYTVQTAAGNGRIIQGTQGNDWIEAPGSNNFISTGKGNDVILAGLEFFKISSYLPYGGEAIFFNTLPVTGNTVINAGAGDDYVAVGLGNYAINLGNGNNIFDGSVTSGNIFVSAGNGDDIIDAGGLGNYQVDAGAGNNWIYLAAGNAQVSAGSSNDVITTNQFAGLSALLSYIFPEEGTPQPYKQVIDAGNGDNQIELPVFGQTSIRTGSGQDFVLAVSLNSAIGGAVNSDTVDILTGSGNDTVITIDTKSLINTGSGDDLIVVGAGDDMIYAGSGRNVINLRGGSISIPSPLNNLGLFASEVTVQGGGNDTLYLEGRFNKVILGSSGFATIYGFDRNDQLDVSGLNATLTRSGQDTLISAGSTSLGVLKGYTGSVDLV